MHGVSVLGKEKEGECRKGERGKKKSVIRVHTQKSEIERKSVSMMERKSGRLRASKREREREGEREKKEVCVCKREREK